MKILMVEDEAMVARALKRMILSLWGKRITSLEHVESLFEAEKHLKSCEIDLLLLDLNLNGEDGFELLGDLITRPFQTIIVSANSDKAIDAFAHGVVDFVPKPFTEERLAQALSRLDAIETSEGTGSGSAQFLGVRIAGKTRLVPIDDIKFIKGADKYSELLLADGSVLLHEKNLRQLIQVLPNNFQRIHKSYIVALTRVRDLISHQGSKYEARLHDGDCIPVGRAFVSDFRSRLA